MSETKCLILYVDDHEDSSEMLKLVLADADYEVHTANSIEDAIQQAQIHQFDLYVVDKRLPDGSGLELCTQLNKLTPGIPCIVYTGDAYEIHRREAMAAGATAYVAKPNVEGLIEKVHQLLEQRQCATA